MDVDFWLQRWQQNRIGFHQDEINPHLLDYWNRLGVSSPARVLVPLCGKSLDLRWLMQQGFQVEGVELSRLAIEAFFSEQGLEPRHTQRAGWPVWEYENLRLWCGDFFELGEAQVGKIDAVYDRAALIALPKDMRPRYARHLGRLSGYAPCLLITLDYPQAQMDGPPFAVPAPEVRNLFGADYDDIEVLFSEDALAASPHLQERGLERLQEAVFSLQVKKK